MAFVYKDGRVNRNPLPNFMCFPAGFKLYWNTTSLFSNNKGLLLLTDTTYKREQHFFYIFSVIQNTRFSYAHMRYYLPYWPALASISSIVFQLASTAGTWKTNRGKLFISNDKINTLTLLYKGAENNVQWAEAVLGQELSLHMCSDLQTMFSNWFTSSVLQYSFLLPPQLEISHGKGAKDRAHDH